jgi:hypothetical protein
LGINANEAIEGVEFYPNPARNFVTITNIHSHSDVRIMDMTGKIVYTNFVADNQLTVNASEFNNGVYFLEIIHKGKSIDNKKMVVINSK